VDKARFAIMLQLANCLINSLALPAKP